MPGSCWLLEDRWRRFGRRSLRGKAMASGLSSASEAEKSSSVLELSEESSSETDASEPLSSFERRVG